MTNQSTIDLIEMRLSCMADSFFELMMQFGMKILFVDSIEQFISQSYHGCRLYIRT